jgi:hypothetical protein
MTHKGGIYMPKTASLNIRLDGVGGLPFDLRPRQPNAESIAAMAEARRIARDPSIKGYRDMTAMFEELNADE